MVIVSPIVSGVLISSMYATVVDEHSDDPTTVALNLNSSIFLLHEQSTNTASITGKNTFLFIVLRRNRTHANNNRTDTTTVIAQ